MTIFLSLAQAVTSALNQLPAIADAVYQAKPRPMQTEHASDLTVTLRQTANQELLGNQVQDFDTQFTVECRVRGVSLNGHALLDPIISSVNKRIQTGQALTDLAYINLSGITFDFDSDADNCAVATMSYTALHRSTNNSLS